MISKEKVKDIIYDIQNEFENEFETIDFKEDLFEYNDVEDLILTFINGFANKLKYMIEEEND